jgi:GTP-binding protein
MEVAHRDDPSVFSLEVEEASLFSALRALRFSQVVVLVVEAGQGKFNKTDIAFGQRCLAEGRAMVIAANKSDLATVSHNEYERVVREQASHFFGDFGEMPIVNCSGLEGRGIARLLKTVTAVHDAWNMRAETWVLNQWLRDVIGFDPPPRLMPH